MFKLPELPTLDCPKLDVDALRNVDFRKFVPNIDAAAIDTDKLTAAVRDAGYVIVGLGVLAVEKAQVVRDDLVETLNDRLASSKTRVETLLSAVEPGALLEQAREFAKSAREQFSELTRIAA